MAMVETMTNFYKLIVRTPLGPHMLHEHIIRAKSPHGENEEEDTFWTDPSPSSSQVDFNNHIWEGMQKLHQSSQRVERELSRTRAELEELRRSSSHRPTGRRRM